MKISSFLSLLLFIQTISADLDNYSVNVHGMTGSINTPSARFYKAPSLSMNLYRGYPDRKISLTAYPYDWLEASLFYTSLKNEPYGDPIFTQDYKDKGFNVKFQIKAQDKWPAIALGVNDIGGTGLYASEYLVSSYQVNNLDFSLGMGWGNLSGKKGFKNPLSHLNDSFNNRDDFYGFGKGGTFRPENYFSGNVSLFASLNIKLKNYRFKLELDESDRTENVRIDYKESKYPLNFGVDYILKNNSALYLYYERGSNLSLGVKWHDDLFVEPYIYKKSKYSSKDKYKKLRESLNSNNVGVSKIEKNDSNTILHVSQYLHSYKQLNNIIENSIKDSEIEEKVIVVYKIAGLEVKNNEVEKNINNRIIFKNNYSGFKQKISLNLRPFIAGREDFIKAALLLEHDSEYIFSENFFFSSNIKISLLDNFDDLIFPPIDTYPSQVRSDIKKYLNNLGEKPSIGRAQFEYFETIDAYNHFLVSFGIYEEMFSGYGVEYLNYKTNRTIDWGFEVHEVFKRDYKFGFGLQGYHNVTYHGNVYYKNSFLIPFNVKLSFGEYLAGDKGATVELSRKFKNGITFGIFASSTNVSKDQFGEGSFDKGIFFTIPFGKNRTLTNFLWRPLTKDPASKLIRKNNLYDLVNRYDSTWEFKPI